MTAATHERALRWRKARHVLAVRLDDLGEVLMTTPALAALRDSLPQAKLSLLTSPSAAVLSAHLPMLHSVWSAWMPWMPGNGGATALGRAECALVDRIAEAEYDAAVVFSSCTQSALPAALLLRMAGVPLRLATCREHPGSLLTDWVPETDHPIALARHEVQRQLALVGHIGCHVADTRLRFAVQPSDRQRVSLRLRAAGLGAGRRYALVHPGASAESRRWPAERFGSVARALADEGHCAVVFSGTVSDLALVQRALGAAELHERQDVFSLAGELGLGELAALVEGASVVVANNSAPAHLAAALGTPVVSLYALTTPQQVPWQVSATVLNRDMPCRWCCKNVCPEGHHGCLQGITAETAVQAALAQMAVAAPAPPSAAAHAPRVSPGLLEPGCT